MTDVPSKHVWKIKESRIVFQVIAACLYIYAKRKPYNMFTDLRKGIDIFANLGRETVDVRRKKLTLVLNKSPRI